MIALLLVACSGPVDGPGTPSLALTEVPPWGDPAPLVGRAVHVDPSDVRVATYLYREASGWEGRPHPDAPFAALDLNGTFSVDLRWSPADREAERMVSFLVPRDWSPPAPDGTLPELPAGLAHDGAVRAPGITWRMVVFSGVPWRVRRTDSPEGPGPNVFSDTPDRVWVDPDGALHLAASEGPQGWRSAEVECLESFGHGTYVLRVDTPVGSLHDDIALGFFTWDPAPDHYHREVDMEFSRWGVPQWNNGQYAVQPWNANGNVERYLVPDEALPSAHAFEWTADRVSFAGAWGDDPFDPADTIHAWVYDGPSVAPPGEEKVHLNLWRYEGWGPPHGVPPAHVVLTEFAFEAP